MVEIRVNTCKKKSEEVVVVPDFVRKKKLAPAQITKARKLVEHGEWVEDVAALWNVRQTTLYRALSG